jgi:protein-arginine kinase activator protein McsA
MVCDKCHIAQASVVVNHVINGHASVFHFCEKCAQEQGLLGGGKIMFRMPMPNFGLVIPSNLYKDAKNSLQIQDIDNEFKSLVLEPLAEKEGRGETYLEKKISDSKEERDKAIKNEDYQSAAMLRDRIKELKQQLQ